LLATIQASAARAKQLADAEAEVKRIAAQLGAVRFVMVSRHLYHPLPAKLWLMNE
jgi:hypothetical protein